MAETVECYSGLEFAERPTAFVWQAERRIVRRVSTEGRTPDTKWFVVVDERDEPFLLTFDLLRKEWSVAPTGKKPAKKE
jgi:hypothetical protein